MQLRDSDSGVGIAPLAPFTTMITTMLMFNSSSFHCSLFVEYFLILWADEVLTGNVHAKSQHWARA